MIFTDTLNLAKYLGVKSAVPLEVARSIIQVVRQQRTAKNIDPVKHWEMYLGNHSQYFKQRTGEDMDLYTYRKKNALTANYVRYIVDLSAKYMYGRASKVSRKFSDNTETDTRMREMTERVGYDFLMLDASKKAGIFGEVGIRLIPIDADTGNQPLNGVSTPNTYPHPIILDPSKTFILLNKWNRIEAVVIEDEYTDYTMGTIARKHKTLELIVADSRWFWDSFDDLTFNNAAPQFSSTNLYGLNDEFVFCKNNTEWIDDIQDILGLNTQLNEMLTDNAHFFARHGWPQLVSSVDLSKVSHSPQHAWEIPSDGPNDKVKDKLYFLQWDGRMEEAHKFIQYIEAMIFKVSSTARIATGDLEAIGSLRSGPAIVTAHSPSIQKTQEKQVIWGDNECRLLNAIATFDAKIHGQAVDTRYKDLDIDITFPRDFVPGEELVRAQIQQINVNSSIRTFTDIIRENHPEFSEDEVAAYREELMADSRDMVDSEREFITKADGTKVPAPSGQSSSATQKSKEQSNSVLTKSS